MEVDDNDDLEEEFGFSRNYFLAKEGAASSGKKSAAQKLSDIGVIDEKELRAEVSGLKPKHENEIKLLVSSYRDLYSKWLFELRCGFNLLTYGFGSKKTLLEDFASTLESYGVVVINGYLQHINIKQAAITIVELLQEQSNSTTKSSRRNGLKGERMSDLTSIEDAISYLSTVKLKDDSFVCIVIHNIDGPGLRDSDTQQYLARIASCSHIRFIASIDHINAPLLWDKKMVHSQFNWCWYHVPTFESYKVEGMFLPLVLTGGATVQSAKTALIVLQSLTPNAQSVFRVIAEYQLAHPKEEGIPTNTLYNMCRERFLVSSQMTLNSHLTEFKDHELIKMRKHSEGQDCFCVPLTSEALGKLLQDLG